LFPFSKVDKLSNASFNGMWLSFAFSCLQNTNQQLKQEVKLTIQQLTSIFFSEFLVKAMFRRKNIDALKQSY